MQFREPIKQLLLEGGADRLYHVIVLARTAEEIGANDLMTWQQFLDAIDGSEKSARFVVRRIPGDELLAWRTAVDGG